MSKLPSKLRADGVVEAILEIRFESSEIPELLLGKIVDFPAWKGWVPSRLPLSDIPLPIRRADKNLQHQPLLQLSSPDGNEALKVGDNVVSRHALTYPGWTAFEPRLLETFRLLYDRIPGLSVTRLGLRYVNLLHPDIHMIEDVNALNLTILVGDNRLTPPLNLNYRRKTTDWHETMIRIASPEFVTSAHQGFSTLIDIDVYTPDGTVVPDYGTCVGWLNDAHAILKDHFFELLHDETIEALKVD
ncbi:TIGR04255 family protein [Mesorhizobium australafricanum]|uniref:TIGR04255 family protein n=1 Tax=Mesorhizobium australafricanum TaxID=3072311 RepID=A0ABU4X4L5_9HYPH|nr:TIGR04255 family protein [Mesorhizobium sp. VK3E]MDX8442014.1 TIGR04255 family protein [Mesorhizobium sp. VK3E]